MAEKASCLIFGGVHRFDPFLSFPNETPSGVSVGIRQFSTDNDVFQFVFTNSAGNSFGLSHQRTAHLYRWLDQTDVNEQASAVIGTVTFKVNSPPFDSPTAPFNYTPKIGNEPDFVKEKGTCLPEINLEWRIDDKAKQDIKLGLDLIEARSTCTEEMLLKWLRVVLHVVLNKAKTENVNEKNRKSLVWSASTRIFMFLKRLVCKDLSMVQDCYRFLDTEEFAAVEKDEDQKLRNHTHFDIVQSMALQYYNAFYGIRGQFHHMTDDATVYPSEDEDISSDFVSSDDSDSSLSSISSEDY